MSVTQRRLRTVAAVALAAVVAFGAAAACGKDSGPSAPGAVHLVLDTFGEFGYDDLIKQYETANPGITIEQRKTAQLGEYRPKLVRYLATNKGSGDVVALEEGILIEFKANPNNWIDLSPYVGDLSADYLSWKYEGGKALDGKLMALPTDVGGLAMCYQTELFKAAGLPTDRDAVSNLWKSSWEDFIKVGQDYRAGSGKAMLDSVTTVFSAIAFQEAGKGDGLIFYDRENNLISDKSPAVKTAWDKSVAMINANITARVRTWSPEWNNGFKNGTFAVTACPSWMRGIISGNSGPENAGKWDVAAVPGGGGNWGGSWLAVPTQSKHPKEAAELAKFLTNATSQVAAFKAKGPLPSNLKALDDPNFLAFQDPYFGNAPVGKIFGEGAKALKPAYLGPKHAGVKERAWEPALQSIEGGQATPEKAWEQAVADTAVQGAV